MTVHQINFVEGKTYFNAIGDKYKCVKRTRYYIVFEHNGAMFRSKPQFKSEAMGSLGVEYVDPSWSSAISARNVIE